MIWQSRNISPQSCLTTQTLSRQNAADDDLLQTTAESQQPARIVMGWRVLIDFVVFVAGGYDDDVATEHCGVVGEGVITDEGSESSSTESRSIHRIACTDTGLSAIRDITA